MPWQSLQDWIEDRADRGMRTQPDPAHGMRPQPHPARPLTLVTLALRPEAGADEVRFYREAEFECLRRWLASGDLLFALLSVRKDELTLLCPMAPGAARAMLEDLPLVAGGLVTPVLRAVRAVALAA